MKIYALVGASGTGKSYKAASLANEKGILYIIDDGLFIKGSKVIAGISAKKEPTMIAAVRRALFMDQEHAFAVRHAILEAGPESILILGTSVNMVKRIGQHLGLPDIMEFTMIEDITTPKEIEIAQKSRREQGKHVIPVPTFEIRKDFSGYFLHPLKILQMVGKDRKFETLEKTVMRPTYSYMGKFYISDSAIESIVSYNTQGVDGVYKVVKCDVVSHAGGVVVYIEIIVIYGFKIHKIMEKIQKRAWEDIIQLTGINVLQINVLAKNIITVKH